MKQQNGNVLFLILIAVALFAALSYAVTQSSRSGGDGVSKDKAKLTASQIIQYATHVEQAISRMKLINRCTDTQIDFRNNFVAGYENPSSQSANRCEVFHPNGGGIQWQEAPKNATTNNNDWVFNGSNTVTNIGTGGQNTTSPTCPGGPAGSCAELVMILSNLDKSLCLEINKKLGVGERSAGEPPKDNTNAEVIAKFIGTYAETFAIATPLLYGVSTGCFEGDAIPASGTYHFYHVLIAR